MPSILEYWLFDKVEDGDGPVLKVFHRNTGETDWTIADYGSAAIYTTALLLGLRLPITPS